MHLDPALPIVVGAVLAILLLGVLLRAVNQPYVVAYLVAGVALGPDGLGLVTDVVLVGRLGDFGILLLLFFVGMEVSPRQLAQSWRVPIAGTALSISACVGIAALVGWRYGWPMPRVVLIGFVMSLSSTAVVLKVLADRGELATRVGRNVLGVLLAQDLAVVPMLVTISVLGGATLDGTTLALQVGGGIAFTVFFVYLMREGSVALPVPKWLRKDHEMQVFSALAVVCTLSLLTGLASLSAALGAFAAGMLIGAARDARWVHHSLEPFRVVFVSFFFVSVGLSLDLDFLRTNWLEVGTLVTAAVIVNTAVVTLIARLLGESWRESLYSGLVLSQLGEFGFLLAELGAHSHIIGPTGHQTAIAVITMSLLLSPLLIAGGRRLVAHEPPQP